MKLLVAGEVKGKKRNERVKDFILEAVEEMGCHLEQINVVAGRRESGSKDLAPGCKLAGEELGVPVRVWTHDRRGKKRGSRRDFAVSKSSTAALLLGGGVHENLRRNLRKSGVFLVRKNLVG